MCVWLFVRVWFSGFLLPLIHLHTWDSSTNQHQLYTDARLYTPVLTRLFVCYSQILPLSVISLCLPEPSWSYCSSYSSMPVSPSTLSACCSSLDPSCSAPSHYLPPPPGPTATFLLHPPVSLNLLTTIKAPLNILSVFWLWVQTKPNPTRTAVTSLHSSGKAFHKILAAGIYSNSATGALVRLRTDVEW